MHFSCLVVTENCPDEAAVDELLWPWCVSNEEQREAKVDYWEATGGRYANTFSIEDVPNDVAFSDATIGPGNQLLKKDVPFKRLAELRQAVLTYAVVKGIAWYECSEMIAQDSQPSEWEQEFAALLDTIDPDCWLTVVDCHR